MVIAVKSTKIIGFTTAAFLVVMFGLIKNKLLK